MTATAPWQYAIDPATLQFVSAPPGSGTLPSPVFDAGAPPLTITVDACVVDWPVAGDTFAAPPPEDPACINIGERTVITLWPYGVCPPC